MAKATSAPEEVKDLALNDDVDGILDLFSDVESTGYENLDNSDFRLTRLKLIQPTSEEIELEGVKVGEIYNSTTKKSSPSLAITIADITKSRVLWPGEQFKRGDAPVCRSGNGKVGVFHKNNLLNSPRPEGGEFPCDQCPFAKWGTGKNGEKVKPACNLSYSVLMILNEDQTPARMNFGGTSYSVFKDFINQCMQKSVALGKKLPANVFNVILSTTREKNDKGLYYVANLQFDPNSVLVHPKRGNIVGVKSLEEARIFRSIAEDAKNMFGEMMSSVAAVDEESRFVEVPADAVTTQSSNSEEGVLF